jgi:2-phospho-L-lactate transferase/gluconeogenesis factor (CofD/UPF0052 family)
METHENLLYRLQGVDYEQDLGGLMYELQRMLETADVTPPAPNPHRHRVISISGGNGASVIGRALNRIGSPFFTALAHTGETREWDGQIVGPGILKKQFGTIDWTHCVGNMIHMCPQGEWTPWHQLLAAHIKRDRFLRKAHVICAASAKVWGIQGALDFFGACLGNRHRVIPTTEACCDIMFGCDGKNVGLYGYANREQTGRIADSSFLSPPSSLGDAARTALGNARLVIIGPGDFHFAILFHFLVEGFREALARVPMIVLMPNLTAHGVDMPGFTLAHLLDLYDQYLPREKDITALVHRGKPAGKNPLADNVLGNQYGRFHIARLPLASTPNQNRRLTHDEQLVGRALQSYVSQALSQRAC